MAYGLRALQQADEIPDSREAQITRLQAEITELKGRQARTEQTIEDPTDMRSRTPARLAARHEEIVRLRATAAGTASVTQLPGARTTVFGSRG